MNNLAEEERKDLNEVFSGTTPVPPNTLQELELDGNWDIMILYIDKLIYTLEVVTDMIKIQNFTIDESSLAKIFEYSSETKKLALNSWKLQVGGLIEIDDRG